MKSSVTRGIQTLAAVAAMAILLGRGPSGQTSPNCTFVDDPITAGSSIRAIHIQELRSCVNDMRASMSLDAYSWTDSEIVAGSTVAKAVHILELRTATNQLLQALGQSLPSYTDQDLTATIAAILAVHVAELRTVLNSVQLPPKTAAPSFNPNGGLSSTPQTVTILSSTSGALIRYTTDGSEPTTTSLLYTSPLTVDVPMTIRARAFASWLRRSDISVTSFGFEVAPPVFSHTAGTYEGQQFVTATTASPGSTLRYTADGSEPHQNSPIFSGLTLYPVTTTSLKVQGIRANWTASPVTTATYTVNFGVAGTPSASPAAGTYEAGQQITLSSPDPGTIIRFTLDGSTPTASSQIYTQPITLDQPLTVVARGFRDGFTTSQPTTHTFTPRVATPTVTPAGDAYESPVLASVVTGTSGATIRYTTDATEPTESSEEYSGAILVSGYFTLKAQAFKPGWAASNVTTESYTSTAPLPTTQATVTPTGVVPTSFAAVGGNVGFQIGGTTISTDPNDTAVYRNGVRLAATSYEVSATNVSIPGAVQEGKNRIELETIDSQGLFVSEVVEVWAGSRTITTTVTTSSGAAVPGATVTSLLDVADVTSSAVTNSQGQAQLTNFPSAETVRLTVTAPNYRSREILVGPQVTTTTVSLDVDNNDFHQGLNGWTLATSRAATIAHSEASTPLVQCGDCQGHSSSPVGSEAAPLEGEGDNDLIVDTKNLLGPQTVTRVFAVAPGTSSVSVRYRFQTDEVFTSYPQNGWVANDSYTVRLRSLVTGQTIEDAQTVLSLWGTYDANAAIPWRSRSLPTTAGDRVEVTLTVANAGDAGHMSILFGDVVQEKTARVAEVRLRDLINNPDTYATSRPDKPLTFLSASVHEAYEGFVRIHGAITIRGPESDSLQAIWLEVLEGSQVSAVGSLARTSVSTVRSALLNQAFGSDQELKIEPSTTDITPVLFEIPSTDMVNIDQLANNNGLSLRIQATLTSGTALQPFPVPQAITKLVLYSGTNRFNTRDLGDCTGLSTSASFLRNRPPFPCGGDSWALPTVKTWAASVAGVTYNDFSNMNGGFFPIHSGHREGDTVDFAFTAGQARDAAGAQRMLTFLNANITRVRRVLVGFSVNQNCSATVPVAQDNPATPQQDEENPYWKVIKNATLADGRPARAVILNTAGHCGHFDVRVNP